MQPVVVLLAHSTALLTHALLTHENTMCVPPPQDCCHQSMAVPAAWAEPLCRRTSACMTSHCTCCLLLLLLLLPPGLLWMCTGRPWGECLTVQWVDLGGSGAQQGEKSNCWFLFARQQGSIRYKLAVGSAATASLYLLFCYCRFATLRGLQLHRSPL